MRVLGFGDNIIDRFLDRGIDYPGGNAVNVAVYAHRHGAHAEYLGVFGDDDAGSFLRASIEDAGVPTSRSLVRRGESGVSSLQVVDGDRTFLGWNGGGVTVREPIDLDDGRAEYAASFDVVHSSVYSGVESQLPRLRETGVLVSFDLSSEPEYRAPAYLDRIAPFADVVLLSCAHLDEEASFTLLEDAVRRGAGLALGTRGVDGAVVADGRNRIAAPARLLGGEERLVDTMGCGDAFVAGFLVSLHGDGWRRSHRPEATALGRALEAGADAARDQCLVEGAFGRGRRTPAAASMR
ncbi:PfkB family carbohydrate kinase [Microbacterium hydrocarbonoxydans]|uniref:PfkB family carbohydrate kinase n=1 Tax=Microbacterium hydrocarbonoxydans TaxID=273678 RepID=UPI0007BB3E57|nr:PfkB family carbohydrate kinase [Microbacterium hydrocarbonoxydans]GAT72169.1 sugar kinase, ribokinase [Microbacterium sp. HM58-2]